MSSVLSSQGLVLATAMAISSTLVFLAFSRKQTLPEPQNATKQSPTLRSCLSSGDKKRDGKKKKVRFAENVEEEKMVERVTDLRSRRLKKLKEVAETKFLRIKLPCTMEFLETGCRGWRVHIEY